MRATFARPQLAAMSVAFDDHGEIVPGRGTTSSNSPSSPRLSPCSPPGEPYVSSRSSVARSRASSAFDVATKCQ
jgi:hypothetical protein